MRVNEQFAIQEWRRDGFLVSTDPARFDLDVIHGFLAHDAYWTPGVAREQVARSLAHSLCFGIFARQETAEPQVGFARVVSDFVTIAYVADVFILHEWRGRGLGKWLVTCLLAHPELQGLRKWMLSTKDAHGLYRPFGFRDIAHPENYLVYRPAEHKS